MKDEYLCVCGLTTIRILRQIGVSMDNEYMPFYKAFYC
jgi:hypothetical protein